MDTLIFIYFFEVLKQFSQFVLNNNSQDFFSPPTDIQILLCFNSCETRRQRELTRYRFDDTKQLFRRSANNRTSGRCVASFRRAIPSGLRKPARDKDLVGTLDLPRCIMDGD